MIAVATDLKLPDKKIEELADRIDDRAIRHVYGGRFQTR